MLGNYATYCSRPARAQAHWGEERQECYLPCRQFSWRSLSHRNLPRKPLGRSLLHDSLPVLPSLFLAGMECGLINASVSIPFMFGLIYLTITVFLNTHRLTS